MWGRKLQTVYIPRSTKRVQWSRGYSGDWTARTHSHCIATGPLLIWKKLYRQKAIHQLNYRYGWSSILAPSWVWVQERVWESSLQLTVGRSTWVINERTCINSAYTGNSWGPNIFFPDCWYDAGERKKPSVHPPDFSFLLWWLPKVRRCSDEETVELLFLMGWLSWTDFISLC